MLTLMIVTVATVLGFQAVYHAAIISHSQFILDKRQENFIIIDSFHDGSKVRVMNRGPITVQVVSVYVNHLLTSNVTSCQVQTSVASPCVISPVDSLSSNANLAWISTGAKLKYGDLLEVVSARGNRVHAFFPIGRTGFSTSSNLYVGTGPLTIIFAPGSFNYTGKLSNGLQLPGPIDAWSGVPAGTSNTEFYLLMVNHGLGAVVLREESVFYMTSITRPASSVQLFCIADASSTPTNIVAYNRQVNPYIIPDNPDGDLAVGGAPVLVKFAATGGSSCSNNGPGTVYNQAQVTAVLLGMVYYWNGDLYSQDIPLATLVLTPGPPFITLNPSSWFVGTPVTVTGTQFAASSTVTISFDGATLTTTPINVTTDLTGAFSATFIVPSTTLGIHTITVTDAIGNTVLSTFTVLASVTQPITVSVANGGSTSGIGTLSGCSVYPATIPFDGSPRNFTASPSCTITVSVPSDSPPTRYRFSGLATTVNVNTCSTGTCTDPRLTAYYQLQNLYRITPLAQTTWDAGLSFTLRGTLSGNSGQIICTISPAGGSGVQSCNAYADYNTTLNYPTNPAGQAANVRWQAAGTTSFTDTTGGNTHNVTYYKQLQNTYRATPQAANWDPGLTITVTGTTMGTSGQILCTLSPTGGSPSSVSCTVYADYNTAVSFPTTASGAGANIQWLGKPPTTFTQTTGGNINNVNYYKQLLNTYAANAFSPATFSPNITFSISGTSLGIAGSSICIITVPASPSPGSYSCSGYADYNIPVTFQISTNNPTNVRWQVSGTFSFSDTTGGNTHTVNYYEQVQNTYQASPLPSGIAWTTGLTITPMGTLAGIAGTTVCTIPPLGGSTSPASCIGWADYNTTVTFPSTASGAPVGTRWASLGISSFTDTTGGGTHNVNYYKQFFITLSYSVSGGGAPSNPIVTFTQFGTATSDTATTSSPPTDWIDAATTISYPQAIPGAVNERWYTAPSTFVASSSTTENPTYYHQYQNTFSASPVAPATFDGSITFGVTGIFNGVSGTSVCAISVPASPSPGAYSCTAYSDSGGSAIFPASSSGSPANTRWWNSANGVTNTPVISSGGTGYSAGYFKQLQNTYQVSAWAQTNFDTGMSWTITGTYLGSGGGTICSISSTATPTDSCNAWADYSMPINFPTIPIGQAVNTRWQASGGTSFTDTTGGNIRNVNYYKQLSNTYQATPQGANWDSGLSVPITGTLLGTNGQTLCTLSPTGGSSSPVTCTAYADYNTAVNFPVTASGAGANMQWIGAAPIAFTQTTGGNTDNVNYYKQLQNTYAANANTPTTFTPQIRFAITGTSLGVASSAICTINVPGSPAPGSYDCTGYADYNTPVSFPTFSTNNPPNVQWQARGATSFTDTSGGNTHTVQYYEELQNTYSAHPVAPGTFSPSITFTVTGTLNGAPTTICTIQMPAAPAAGNYNCQGYADYNTAVTMPTTSGNNPANVRWQISGAPTFTDTTGGNTHTSNYYEQLQNTYIAAPSTPSTWDATLSIPVTRTLLGSPGQSLCTIITTNGGGSVQCSGWADYNTQVTVASPVAVSASEQWIASGSNTFTDTSGGLTHTVNYVDQFQVSFAVSPSGSGSTIPSGSNVWETYGSLAITATPAGGFVFLSWGSSTGSITFAIPNAASTTATIQGTGTITANFGVSQSITLSVAESGAPTPTFTLSGCNVSPNTIVSDASPHSVAATPSCAITISTPPDGSNTRFRFNSGGSPSSTWTVITCAIGPCPAVSNTVHYQYFLTLSYSVNAGGSPTAPTFTANQLGSPFGQLLTTPPTGYWFDSGSSWTATNPLSPSGSQERWQTNQATTGTVASAQTIVFAYYHQYLQTLSYSVIGGGSPFAPTFTADHFGAPFSQILTTTPTGYWFDNGASWSGTNPLSPSGASERWQTDQSVAGLITSAQATSFTYLHQYLVTASYSTSDSSTPSPIPMLSGTAFGSPATLTLTTSSQSIWLDAGTTAAAPSTIPSSPSTERWIATSGTSISVGLGASLTPQYYHQFAVTASYGTSDGSTPSSNVTLSGTSLGNPSTTNLTTAPQTLWLDASSSWAVNNPIPASPTIERWIASSGTFGTVSGVITISPSYTHQYLLTITVTPSTVGVGNITQTPTGQDCGPASPTSMVSCWYNSGTSVTLNATTPVSGGVGVQYVFVNWIGAASSNSTNITLTVNAAATVTANYVTQFLVAFNISPTGGGSIAVNGNVTSSGTSLWFTMGSTITITATPSGGFAFTSWTSDTGSITFGDATSTSTTATISGTGSITANFA